MCDRSRGLGVLVGRVFVLMVARSFGCPDVLIREISPVLPFAVAIGGGLDGLPFLWDGLPFLPSGCPAVARPLFGWCADVLQRLFLL